MRRYLLSWFGFALITATIVTACSRSPTAAPVPARGATTRDSSPSVPSGASGPSGASSSSGAVTPDTVRAEREYRGSYTRGWEASWFAPCDAPRHDALWWVTLTEPARLQRDSLLGAISQPATGALAVRWRGTISNRMPAGQMGRGTRYMLVTEVIEVRPLTGMGMCAPPGRSS